MTYPEILQDAAAIATPGMFRREPFNFDRILELGCPDKTYHEWCKSVGFTELLRNWDRDDHWIRIRSEPKRWSTSDYGQLATLADSGDSMLVLQFPKTPDNSPRFMVSQGCWLKHTSLTFAEWVGREYARHKRRYGVRRWRYLMRGPKPFTEEESRIVLDRALWSVAVARNQADAPPSRILVELTNGSQSRLDTLTATRQEPKSWEGDVWIDASGITPGESAIRSISTIEGKFRAEEVVLKVKPVNGPEDRRYVRELEGFVTEP